MEDKNPYVRFLHQVIRIRVEAFDLLIVPVILWSIGDVLWILNQRLSQPPLLLLRVSDILFLFGALLVVLIAIEIFINITLQPQ